MSDQIQLAFSIFISIDDLPQGAEISVCSSCGQQYLSESGQAESDWYCPCCV